VSTLLQENARAASFEAKRERSRGFSVLAHALKVSSFRDTGTRRSGAWRAALGDSRDSRKFRAREVKVDEGVPSTERGRSPSGAGTRAWTNGNPPACR